MGRTKQTDKTNTEVQESSNISQPETDATPVIPTESQDPSEEKVELPEETNDSEDPIDDNKPETSEDKESEKEVVNDAGAKVLEIMRLYPQYEEFWLTPEGFVRPKGVAKYLIKGATLYKNKYYQK